MTWRSISTITPEALKSSWNSLERTLTKCLKILVIPMRRDQSWRICSLAIWRLDNIVNFISYFRLLYMITMFVRRWTQTLQPLVKEQSLWKRSNREKEEDWTRWQLFCCLLPLQLDSTFLSWRSKVWVADGTTGMRKYALLIWQYGSNSIGVLLWFWFLRI